MLQQIACTAARSAHPLVVADRQLIAAHEQIASILRSRLGRDHADLLAQPRPVAEGDIAWSTPLAGEVQPAARLPADEQQRLRGRAETLVADIRTLAERMRGEGPTARVVAQMLDGVVQMPAGDWLYSVAGKPVLVMWGHGDAPGAIDTRVAAADMPAPAPPASAPRATAAARVADTGATDADPSASAADDAATAAPVAAVAARRPRMPRWLWLALLVLLTLASLWLLQRCADRPAVDADLLERLKAAERRNDALEQEIARRRALVAQVQCVPEPVATPASQPPPPPPPPQQAEADPYDALKERVAAAGSDCAELQRMLAQEPLLNEADPRSAALKAQMAEVLAGDACRERMIKEAKNLCPEQRPQELAPELVIVLDASGSMDLSLLATDAEIQQAEFGEAVREFARMFGQNVPSQMERLYREPKRISAAKQAATAVVQKAPSDANIGLVLIEDCPGARSVGYFPPARRAELLSKIAAVRPVKGTPLADAVRQAGAMLDGVKRESTMLVVSDGVEFCGQDPCAVARALARVKPHLRINVVDIMGTGAGNCLAQATGGKVYTARNASEVELMTGQAAGTMAPADCATR